MYYNIQFQVKNILNNIITLSILHQNKNKHVFGDKKQFDDRSQFANDLGYDANGEILFEELI